MKFICETPCIEINCQELYAREDFGAWLNTYASKGLATWHTSGEPGEYSDIFMTYEHGEGSDGPNNQNGMPEECWDIIDELCRKHGVGHAVLWLKNLDE